jgi:hypothetical protein
MNELEKQNSIITSEADKILHHYGLLRIMNKYGKPVLTGSYVLRLMTWRDLDINLEINELTEKRFFRMGEEIASILKPYRISFRNEFLTGRAEMPLGFYYGIHTNILGSLEKWKIDIWALDADQINRGNKELAELWAGIDNTKRLFILEIKNRFCKHPEYLHGIHSMDIYDAVIKHGIRTVEEFSTYYFTLSASGIVTTSFFHEVFHNIQHRARTILTVWLKIS